MQQHNLDLCILLETRLSGGDLARARHRLLANWGFYAIECRGLVGGIIVTWREDLANINVFHNRTQQLVIVISKSNGSTWFLSGMYASIEYRERRVVWHEVARLIDEDVPSLVVGDFNYIDSTQEKRGGRPFTNNIESWQFRDFIRITGLVDLGFFAPRFP